MPILASPAGAVSWSGSEVRLDPARRIRTLASMTKGISTLRLCTFAVLMGLAMGSAKAAESRSLTIAEALKDLQDAVIKVRADAAADRRELKGDTKRIEATMTAVLESVTQLQTENRELRQRVDSNESEMRGLRSELTKLTASGTQFATQDQIKALTQKLNELNDKHDADNKLVLAENRKILTRIDDMIRKIDGVSSRPTPSAPKVSLPPNVKVYEYTVLDGQFVSHIVDAWNANLKEKGYSKSVNLDMIKAVNPGLDPDRIRVGQKINLPYPE